MQGHDPVPRRWAASSQGESWQVAGRYRLLSRLDKGGIGEVYLAEDRLAGEVAIKLLPTLEDSQLFRLRSELSALRILQLPGVARLLDEGVHDQRPFLVMEVLRGRPFPGGDGTGTWETIRETVIALLETLARVHAMGVVHRDLKPDNVLVDESGRPTVLDFGLSTGRALGSGLDQDCSPVGTPRYASPEQIQGRSTDERSDLYSLGVMLFEVLAGRGPQGGAVADQVIQKRLHEPAPPLAESAPRVPATVARLVDQLLAREPHERPRSALEVLTRIRGGEPRLAAEQELPRLGGDALVRTLLEAARRGRAVDLVGAPGTGRTRCLREVRQRLEREGRRVLWIVPESGPFASLEPLREWVERGEPESLDRALEIFDRAIRRVLEDGVLLLVDELERLDRWSTDLLRRYLGTGCMIATFTPEELERGRPATVDVLHVEPLTEEELRPLFTGPERLFHLPDDAARELWLRTDGNPARVTEEVGAWVRAGLAQWAGGQVAVDRHALDRLRAGLQVRLPILGSHALVAPLDESLDELLAWIAVTAPRATPKLLSTLRGQSTWRVEAELEELVEAGAARWLPGGTIEALILTGRSECWTEGQRRAAHSRIAAVLDPGSDGRLFNLVAADELSEVPLEARTLVRRLVRDGRLGEAEAALTAGLDAARRTGDAEEEYLLFREWILVAFAGFTTLAMDRVLYELSRAIERSDEVVHLEQLVDAAVRTFETDGERALAEVEAVPPFDDPEFERWRQGLRGLAARGCSLRTEEEVLDAFAEWASRQPSRQVRATLAEWMGRLRYRQERYDEAAELQAEAAQLAEQVSARLSAMLNGASALMEACRFDEVTELGERARSLAAACRHSLYEVRAEWLLRSADYRRGVPSEPDLELAEAAGLVGVRDQEALICLTEAAFAWRGGRLEQARDLALRTWRCWTASGQAWGALLARSLALASGVKPAEGELEGIAERALLCHDAEITGQILCLVHRAGLTAQSSWTRVAEMLRAKFPSELWSVRREILSVSEVLEWTGGSAAGDSTHGVTLRPHVATERPLSAPARRPEGKTNRPHPNP